MGMSNRRQIQILEICNKKEQKKQNSKKIQWYTNISNVMLQARGKYYKYGIIGKSWRTNLFSEYMAVYKQFHTFSHLILLNFNFMKEVTGLCFTDKVLSSFFLSLCMFLWNRFIKLERLEKHFQIHVFCL